MLWLVGGGSGREGGGVAELDDVAEPNLCIIFSYYCPTFCLL